MIQIKNNPSNKIPSRFTRVNFKELGVEVTKVTRELKLAEEPQTFHHQCLESPIRTVSHLMYRLLRRLAEENGGELSDHQRNINDVYLMGRGELLSLFLDEASTLLNAPAKKIFSRSLDSALERVASDLYGTDNVDFLTRFRFTLPPRASIPPAASTLSVMKLEYRSPWPLPLIYTAQAIDSYNSIFIFLLGLKGARKAVSSAWSLIPSIEQPGLRRLTERVHLGLTSLLTSLESYVFVDVIMTETQSLGRIIQESDSFEEVCLSHASFLSNLLNRLFLPAPAPPSAHIIPKDNTESVDGRNSELRAAADLVQKEIGQLLKLSQDLEWRLKVATVNPEAGFKSLTEVKARCDRLTSRLLSLVTIIDQKSTSQHLSALLMRLDYNHHYTRLAASTT